MKNVLYLGFFVLRTNYSDLFQSFSCTNSKGYSRVRLLFDMIWSSLRYGSSFVDYFNFRFFEKNHGERSQYASMGTMYRFHNKINNEAAIDRLDNKKNFFVNFKSYCNPAFLFSSDQLAMAFAELSRRINRKVVIKDPSSTGGKGVQIFPVYEQSGIFYIGESSLNDFLEGHFKTNESLYFEDFIEQHEVLNKVSPTGVNTIRVITLINDLGQVEIIGSVFRISVNCNIDNYSAGNLAAEIDKNTGIVVTGGIRKRSSCDIYHDLHPVTNEKILGLKIPYWEETILMVKQAAMVEPRVRSVGWDVAITQHGPVLIEGNSKWNKDTWQIPAGRGKLEMIKQYL